MKKENRAEAKVRKAAAKKKAETAKKLKIAGLIAIPVIVVAAIIIAAVVGKNAYSLEFDYSEGLDSEGLIADIAVEDYVDVCDYENITVLKASVEMTEEQLNEHIDSLLTEYSVEELTDEIIVNNYSDVASTVDEYLAYVKESTLETNIENYVYSYVMDNSTVKSTPKAYYKILKNNTDKQYLLQFNYYNEMMYTYTGSYAWSSYLEYYDMSRSEYKHLVKDTSDSLLKDNLIFQYIYEDAGLSITDEDINEAMINLGYEESDFESCKVEFGLPYLKQVAIANKVMTYLAENANVQ